MNGADPGQPLAAPRNGWRGDLSGTLLGLAALLAWDASGADLAVMRRLGSVAGFAWRDSWWTSRLLHDGGRWAAWALLLTLAIAAWRAAKRPADATAPTATERWRWIGVMLLAVLAVPTLKQFSATSCPWDLAEFGGHAIHVSHWHLGRGDGGAGHCFPSGHAVAAFAFFGMHFQWRGHDRRRARAWLLAVLVGGVLFGAVQALRGAHYPSHTLWSAWLCWTICVAAARWPRRWALQPQPA